MLDDGEYRELQKTARKSDMTVSQWVRAAIAAMRNSQPHYETRHKLAAVREAVTHSYPSGDISQMLDEIESGYSSGRQ